MKYYLKLFQRRLPVFMLVAMVISVISFGVAVSLPPVYVSQARFLLESSQIPSALAPPTVNTPAREQLQLFEQRLMNRTNLLDIARRLTVFPDQARMTPDEIFEAMREQTTVSSSLTKDGAAIMTVSFQARSGQRAAAVMNEYMTVIQREDVESRTGRAGQTQDFFQQEVDRLNSDMAAISAKLIEFKTLNSDALPDGQPYRLGQQGILQERIAQSDREVSTLKTQRQRLIEIFNATGQVQGIEGASQTPEQKQLAELRNTLSQAQTVYAPTNPKIKVLEGQIKKLEAVVAQQLGTAQTGASPLDLQLADIDSRVQALEEQKTQTQAELDKLNDAIARTAANGVQLEALERDYSNVQGQYNAAVADLAKASTGERIESLSRGQRLTVLEQPIVPNAPDKPNRVLLAGGGTIFGILAGLGLIVLIEKLNSAPRRPEAIVRKLGITPLATLPYIQSHTEQVRRRRLSMGATLAIMICVPLAVWALHNYYMPLDLLAQKVGNRFGLRW
jgi:uncharacterized protein involved in exopolysaccharide biosynthesis